MLSLAYGAKVIEKHFTIDKKLKGPDQEASILPEDFLKLVNMVKKAKIILISHLGRPKGKRENDCSLLPIYKYLKRKINSNIFFSWEKLTMKLKIKVLI